MAEKKGIKYLAQVDYNYKVMGQVTKICIICFFVLTILGFTLYTRVVLNAAQHVFVADDFGTRRIIDKEAQVKGHVTNFTKLFFQIDQYNYKTNTNRALNLIGESGKMLNKIYSQNNWYQNIVDNNMNISIDIDSILVHNNNFPYQVNCFAKMTIRNANSSSKRYLISQMSVWQVSNSDDNPYGLMIEDYKILNNQDYTEPKQ